jgi:hypothetical protein
VAPDSVVSTVDPDARHTRKPAEARRDGYRAHLAADPETGIITDEKLTRAAGTENSDPAVAEGFVAAEAGRDHAPARLQAAGHGSEGDGGQDELPAWYGDSAYGTGDLRGAIADAGHQAVIKPRPLRPPVKGGLTVDDFAVDEQAGTVSCPAGHTVALSRTRVATSTTGRKLVLHPRDDLLRAARAGWAATGLRKDYTAWRPNVERCVLEMSGFPLVRHGPPRGGRPMPAALGGRVGDGDGRYGSRRAGPGSVPAARGAPGGFPGGDRAGLAAPGPGRAPRLATQRRCRAGPVPRPGRGLAGARRPGPPRRL